MGFLPGGCTLYVLETNVINDIFVKFFKLCDKLLDFNKDLCLQNRNWQALGMTTMRLNRI